MPLPKASFNSHSINLDTASLISRALCALVFSIYSLKQILDTAKVSAEVVFSGNNELYLHSQNKKFIRRQRNTYNLLQASALPIHSYLIWKTPEATEIGSYMWCKTPQKYFILHSLMKIRLLRTEKKKYCENRSVNKP